MSTIQNVFVRARRWQIFVGAATLALVAQVLMLRTMFLPGNDTAKVPLAVIIALGACAIYLALWLWSVGAFLHSIVESRLRLNLNVFRMAVIFPLIYAPVFAASLYSLRPALFLIIFPLHLFATFSVFCSFRFVSKSLALVERASPVSFPDYRGSFLGLWFFPVGVWFIQPRINRLYAGTLSPQAA
jgi:hypothetical protein